MRLPYWAFVVFLTPAIVLQTAGGTEAIVHSIVERTGYTVIGGAAAVIVLTIGHALITGKHRHHDRDLPT